MELDRSTQLGQGSIPSLILKFSAPAIAGTLAQAMYNVVDTIFVGRALGKLAIAGTTVAMPPMLMVLAFGMLIGFGAAALISIRLGEKKKGEAERILGNAATLLIVASIVTTALGLFFLEPILKIAGASAEIMPFARPYLRIILIGTVFQTVLFGLNAAIRGEGNPRVAMMTMLISVLLNVALAPIFIFWFHWGMQGAAWATVIAQAFSAVWVVGYFLFGRSVLKLHARNLLPDWRIVVRILAVGSPACAMMFVNALLQIFLNFQLHKYGGDVAISVWGIIYRVLMMVFMPVIGLNQGSQPIIGYNHGARRFDRVKKCLETAILAATGFAVLGFAVSMLFPAQVIRLFGHGNQLVGPGTHAMRLCTLALPLVGFQIISAGYFQAVGRPAQAMILMLSRQVILLIPAVLILPHFLGLNGIWASLPTADFGAFLWTAICLVLELRNLRDKHEAMATA